MSAVVMFFSGIFGGSPSPVPVQSVQVSPPAQTSIQTTNSSIATQSNTNVPVQIIQTQSATSSKTSVRASQPSFSASPTSGSAPLTVTFESSFVGAGHSIDFGDGHETVSNDNCFVHSPCTAIQITARDSYVYYTPGTYTATLKVGGNALGTATIIVTTTQGQPSATITQISPALGQSYVISGSDPAPKF